MTSEPLRILEVSPSDATGGAEMMALALLDAYRRQGHSAALAVGFRAGDRSDVVAIPSARWRHWLRAAGRRLTRGHSGALPRIGRGLSALADLTNHLSKRRGRECFHFPGTRRLLEIAPFCPQVIHAHNLHGNYFDLRCLPALSRRVPVLLTLHDAWLVSGHCAHSFECERWMTGCGSCPDLTIFPAIERDETAANWRQKRDIFQQSRVYVATPCAWLMRKVKQSLMASAIIEGRVIPNGIDLSVFKPGVRDEAREAIGCPRDAAVVMLAANAISGFVWKDCASWRVAMEQIARTNVGRKLIFLAVGEKPSVENIGDAEIRFVPYQHAPADLVRYYQAADLYVHPARADTFPTVVLEALACGTPVVATDVGGIPEQVDPGQTGYLVPPLSPDLLASRVIHLLQNRDEHGRMSACAAAAARERFGIDQMAQAYLEWLAEIVHHGPHSTPPDANRKDAFP